MVSDSAAAAAVSGRSTIAWTSSSPSEKSKVSSRPPRSRTACSKTLRRGDPPPANTAPPPLALRRAARRRGTAPRRGGAPAGWARPRAAAAEPVDDTGEHLDADDLTEWWVNDLVDLARDGRAVCAGDGALVGVAVVVSMRGVREDHRVLLEGRVHPGWRGRGLGRALLDWQLRRGEEVHRRDPPELPARLTVSVYPGMGSLESLARRAGFAAERWYADMARPLTGLPEVPAVPDVELVPFAWDRDDEVRRAGNPARPRPPRPAARRP